VTVDPAVVQNMGVKTAAVIRGPMTVAVQAVGMLNVPEPAVRDISLKVSGWIETLHADTQGMHVHEGEPLFELYSPDVLVAGEELVAAVRASKSIGPDASPALHEQTDSLIASAKRKLQLWDIADRDIDAIAQSDHAPRTVTIRSPISGHLVDKVIAAGSAATAGMKLMRIEDHSRLWLDAEIYADDFSSVAIGQIVDATIEGIPGKTFTSKISFIYPHVDHMTRTLLVRATLNNDDGDLRPGMYASVRVLTEPTADALLVPTQSVIDTGSEQIAFVALGGGHFQPRQLKVGRHGDDVVEILSGLAPGESVVTSGQFLLDVESNTNAAIARLQSEHSSEMPAATTMPTEMMREDH
jgi:RND family efflux transporter MFP subunit